MCLSWVAHSGNPRLGTLRWEKGAPEFKISLDYVVKPCLRIKQIKQETSVAYNSYAFLNSGKWTSHFAFRGSSRSWKSFHLLVAPMAGIAKGWAGIGLSSGTFST